METFIEAKKETRLENAIESGGSIAEILDSKVEHYRESGLPVEESTADYIALGIQSQREKIEQYKAYKKELDNAIKTLQELEKETEAEVFEWLEANGIEKLKGIHVSSITAKPASTSIRTKIVRDVTDKELVELGYAHEEEVISEIQPGVKINKKRIKKELKNATI